VPIFPSLTYQLFFDSQTDKAAAELDKDIRRTTRATLRTAKSHPPASFLKEEHSFLAAWDEVEEVSYHFGYSGQLKVSPDSYIWN